jgi:hypothetical protein
MNPIGDPVPLEIGYSFYRKFSKPISEPVKKSLNIILLPLDLEDDL